MGNGSRCGTCISSITLIPDGVLIKLEQCCFRCSVPPRFTPSPPTTAAGPVSSPGPVASVMPSKSAASDSIKKVPKWPMESRLVERWWPGRLPPDSLFNCLKSNRPAAGATVARCKFEPRDGACFKFVVTFAMIESPFVDAAAELRFALRLLVRPRLLRRNDFRRAGVTWIILSELSINQSINRLTNQ